MRAMLIREFGGADGMEAAEVPDPEPAPGEVLVRVHAAGVNPVDYKVRRAGLLLGLDTPLITGYEASGVVAATGEGADDFAEGDEVYYTIDPRSGQGTFAELHAVPQAIVARKPAALDHVEAGCLALGGGTAWDAVMERARVSAGETVLVHGAGGVGAHAVQIARAAGARVLVTCGEQMIERARELGADVAVDYRGEDFAAAVRRDTDGRGVDVVVDTVGGDLVARSVAVTVPRGRIVAVVDMKQPVGEDAFEKNLTLHCVVLEPRRERLERMAELAERGGLRPAVDSVVPLEEVPSAQEAVHRGGLRGKVVVKVAR